MSKLRKQALTLTERSTRFAHSPILAVAGNFVLFISGYLWFRSVTAGFLAGFAFSAILGGSAISDPKADVILSTTLITYTGEETSRLSGLAIEIPVLGYFGNWGYFWGIWLLLVQNLTSYSCSATPISCKGDESSRLSRLIFEIWRGTGRQTDDRRDDRCIRLLHCTVCVPNNQQRFLYRLYRVIILPVILYAAETWFSTRRLITLMCSVSGACDFLGRSASPVRRSTDLTGQASVSQHHLSSSSFAKFGDIVRADQWIITEPESSANRLEPYHWTFVTHGSDGHL